MTAQNDYAYRQVMGALPRRGAQVDVSEDGLTVTGTFADPSAAEFAWIALGSKYPSSGPNAVKVSRQDNTLTFQFAPSGGMQESMPASLDAVLSESRAVKINSKQLRSLIKEAIQGRQPGSPLWEAPGEYHHPLESDEDGIPMNINETIQTLADQLIEYFQSAGSEETDIDEVHVAVSNDVREAVRNIISNYA